MRRSRLIDLLKNLETRERTRFRELVFSPFFNKNQKIQGLCRYILAYAPTFDHENLRKEKIYPNLFPEEPYSELRINNVISDLLALLYEFLAWKKYREVPQLQKDLLLSELQERELATHVNANLKRYRKIQDNSSHRNFEHFHHEYRLFEQLDRFSLVRGKRGYDESLQSKSDMLDLYYLTNKLRIACDMTSRNIVVNAGYQCHFIEELLQQVNQTQSELLEIPAVKIYDKVYQMLRHDRQESHYFNLKELLEQHIDLFPQGELRILYSYAQNYCVKMINSGNTDYYQEILDLYKILLRRKIIFKNGYLTQWSFTNIITAGIRLKDYDWTEDFIHEYQHSLLPQVRHNVFTYNLAALYFEKKEYPQALQQLHDVEFTDAFYHMAAKIIQLKSYYILDEVEPFFALVEASRKYIRRNRQLSDYQKQSNQNFLKMISRLYNLRIKHPQTGGTIFQEQWESLREQLNNTKSIANKDWLLQSLKKLSLSQ